MSAALGGKVAQVRLMLRGGGYDLRPMDEGKVRHPVFGHRRVWVLQRVTAHVFTDSFQAQAPGFRDAVLKAANETFDDIARGF